jgi:hypothetical protein
MTNWSEIWEIRLSKRIGDMYHENYEEINGLYWLAFWLFIIFYLSNMYNTFVTGILD